MLQRRCSILYVLFNSAYPYLLIFLSESRFNSNHYITHSCLLVLCQRLPTPLTAILRNNTQRLSTPPRSMNILSESTDGSKFLQAAGSLFDSDPRNWVSRDLLSTLSWPFRRNCFLFLFCRIEMNYHARGQCTLSHFQTWKLKLRHPLHKISDCTKLSRFFFRDKSSQHALTHLFIIVPSIPRSPGLFGGIILVTETPLVRLLVA